jgi:hypothetical protein
MASRHMRSRRHRSRRHRHRGGAASAPITTPGPMNSQNSPDPSAYSSAAGYGYAVNGSESAQYGRVFDVNGPSGSTDSNAIIGLQGQRAGSRRRRGGFWGQVVNQAVVPLSILGMQQSYRRKRHGGRKSRRHSRRHHKR